MQKSWQPVSDPNCELQTKENMLFSGTAIANGTVVGVVTSTGMATEIGKIQSQIQEAANEDSDTPLKKKLNHFGEMLAQVRGPGGWWFGGWGSDQRQEHTPTGEVETR